MNTQNCTKVLSETEREELHKSACQVLEELGMKIESKSFLKVLDNFGYAVDYDKEVVYFPKKIVEEYLEKAGGKKANKRTSSL